MRSRISLRTHSRSILVAVMAGAMLGSSPASAASTLTPIVMPIVGGAEGLIGSLEIAGARQAALA